MTAATVLWNLTIQAEEARQAAGQAATEDEWSTRMRQALRFEAERDTILYELRQSTCSNPAN